ncbi:MAG TPA: asparaginase [Candidatus Limnocylindrales bacterium]
MAPRTPAKASRWSTPPVLVRQVRGSVVESVHRGDIVEVDVAGRVRHAIGDPDRVVFLRSTVKPFGLLSLLRAGGQKEFDLTPDELAIMASSHSGEDVHVRTIQAMYRRIGIGTGVLACGTEGMPLDELTAARLARDGERPSPLRHMCSGQHSVFVLLAKLGGWGVEGYWEADHPSTRAYRETVAAAFDVKPDRLQTGIDGCGLLTYAFALREVARAYAMLAAPDAIPADDRRAELATHLIAVRDAMMRHPELVGGTRERLDTALMKTVPGRVVSKSGMEALRGVGILRGRRNGTADSSASGFALKMEDGDGYERGTYAATVEGLRQVGLLDESAVRQLGRYHRTPSLDPHGNLAAEAIPEFELGPVGELVG